MDLASNAATSDCHSDFRVGSSIHFARAAAGKLKVLRPLLVSAMVQTISSGTLISSIASVSGAGL